MMALAWLLALATCPQAGEAGLPSSGQGGSEFELGVEAYRAGDYRSAESRWRRALELGEVDAADVLYNLGDNAWRRERPLEAAAWFTASLRLDPRRAAAWANLELARAEAGVAPADRGDLTSTARRFAFAFTRGESEWLALGGVALLALALAHEALRGGAVARRLALAAGLFAALAAAPFLAHLVRGEGPAMLVVAPEGAAVRGEPAPEGALVGRFAAASEVRPLDRLPGWVRAEGGGAEGWVAAEELHPITPPWR